MEVAVVPGTVGVAPLASETTRRGGTDHSGWCLPDVDDVIAVEEGRLQSELSWGDARGWVVALTRKKREEEGKGKSETDGRKRE